MIALPVQMIKPIAEYIASPLTHIINMGITEQKFQQQWKISKITPIPKVDDAETPDQYRPVPVLPILSKVYERLIVKQVCNYVQENNIYKSTRSGFRKKHSTSTFLMKMRDDT